MHMPKNIQLRTSEDKQTFLNQATINGKIERLRLERYYKWKVDSIYYENFNENKQVYGRKQIE